MIRLLNGDTDFFDIVPEVLQVDTLAQFLFKIYLNYVLQTSIYPKMKENGFTRKKTRSIWYLTEMITDAHYADGQTLHSNILVQTESLLHSLEQAVIDIRLNMNNNKTEFIRFNQDGAISCIDSAFTLLAVLVGIGWHDRSAYLPMVCVWLKQQINRLLESHVDEIAQLR